MAYGRYEQAIELLEPALAAEPLREDLQQLLAQAQSQKGNQGLSRRWAALAGPALAVTGGFLVWWFPAESAECVVGWTCVVGSAIVLAARRRPQQPPDAP